jgi:hypothetical protein
VTTPAPGLPRFPYRLSTKSAWGEGNCRSFGTLVHGLTTEERPSSAIAPRNSLANGEGTERGYFFERSVNPSALGPFAYLRTANRSPQPDRSAAWRRFIRARCRTRASDQSPYGGSMARALLEGRLRVTDKGPAWSWAQAVGIEALTLKPWPSRFVTFTESCLQQS